MRAPGARFGSRVNWLGWEGVRAEDARGAPAVRLLGMYVSKSPLSGKRVPAACFEACHKRCVHRGHD